MTQWKILVDSNAYFRLTKEIHPLLAKPFGPENSCLYIIEGFDDEFLKSSRLRSVFGWAGEAQYKENRQRKVTLSRAEKERIVQTFPFLMSTAVDMGLTTG
jgi:hypothetical protein